MNNLSAFMRKPWYRFTNVSNEQIPAFAVMRIVGATVVNGEIVFSCAKPSSTFNRWYLVNGPFPCETDSKEGFATTLTHGGFVLYESSDGSPATGEEWGPWPFTWSLRKGRLGFTCMSTGDGTKVVAAQREVVSVWGKLYEDLNQGSSAYFKIWLYYDGKFRDSQYMIQVFDWYLNREESIEKDTKAEAAWWSGRWHIRNAYCSPDDTNDSRRRGSYGTWSYGEQGESQDKPLSDEEVLSGIEIFGA